MRVCMRAYALSTCSHVPMRRSMDARCSLKMGVRLACVEGCAVRDRADGPSCALRDRTWYRVNRVHGSYPFMPPACVLGASACAGMHRVPDTATAPFFQRVPDTASPMP